MPTLNQWDAREKLRSSGIAYAAMRKVMEKVPNTSHRSIDSSRLPEDVFDIFVKEGLLTMQDGRLSLASGATQRITRSYNLGPNEVVAVLGLLNEQGMKLPNRFAA